MKSELECDVYRSETKEFLYLYVRTEDGLTQVPEALLSQFGTPEKTLPFVLSADRTLAREDPMVVIRNLEAQGYHLQLPPADERFDG